MNGTERNKPCHCGSGIKAKKCPCFAAVARIVKRDHPALATVSDELKPGDNVAFLRVMARACKGARGAGLAANQIGVTKRAVFIYADQITERFMLNPLIVWKSDTTRTDREGCLSYPGVLANVPRHDSIRVQWDDENFGFHHDEFHGWEARVIQHEVDHLDGICRVGDEWKLQRQETRRRVQAALSAFAMASSPLPVPEPTPEEARQA